MYRRRFLGVLVLVLIANTLYALFVQTITIDPVSEAAAMERLERTKERTPRSPFVSDGCSGNVSAICESVVSRLSQLPSELKPAFASVESIPFEAVCVSHDRSYHAGEGGYEGRLQADNQLRSGIIDFGIEHQVEIRDRTGLSTTEEAIRLYEEIARFVYEAVRSQGGPCSGRPYAWGFGFGAGTCVEQ